MKNRPIGIIDSGVGGLSVWREITALLPHESTVYLGDNKHCPYGTRTPEEIIGLSIRMVRTLLYYDIKLLVVACNTITVTALDVLRSTFPELPIVGTVPVVKTAVKVTQTGKIGILSTLRTAESLYQKHLLEEFAQGKEVTNKGTNRLVPLIEEGIIHGSQVDKVLKDVLEPFEKAKVDVLALGCTHYPFLKPEMQLILGPSVKILDSGDAVARQVGRILEHNGQKSTNSVHHTFLTTESEKKYTQIFGSLLGSKIPVRHTNLLS